MCYFVSFSGDCAFILARALASSGARLGCSARALSADRGARTLVPRRRTSGGRTGPKYSASVIFTGATFGSTRNTVQPCARRAATAASVGASSVSMPPSPMAPDGGAISTACPTRGTSGGALKSALYHFRKRCYARKRCCTISAHFGMNRMVSGNLQPLCFPALHS